MPRPATQKNFRRVVTAALMAGLGSWLSACEAPPRAEGPTEITLRIVDYETFFDSALTLLREHDLAPQHVDRSRGRVITRAATSGQWFEFWRADSHGGYQALESSLHTVRRWASLSIEQDGADGEYRLRVQVDKQRFSSPQRQVTTASGALGIYSERLPTEEGLRASQARGDHWVPLGRDVLMENYLLRRLAELPGRAPTPAPASSAGEARAAPSTGDARSPRRG